MSLTHGNRSSQGHRRSPCGQLQWALSVTLLIVFIPWRVSALLEAFSWILSWHCWLVRGLICYLFSLLLDAGEALLSVLSGLLSFCTFSLGISFIPKASYTHADGPHIHASGLAHFPEKQIQYPTVLTTSVWKSNRNFKPMDPC